MDEDAERIPTKEEKMLMNQVDILVTFYIY